MAYDNIEYCGFYRMAYNQYTWCMNDIEACNFEGDFGGRVFRQIPVILQDMSRFWKLFSYDDTCSSDKQQFKEIALLIESMASFFSVAQGFEGKWDESEQMEYIDLDVMLSNASRKQVEYDH